MTCFYYIVRIEHPIFKLKALLYYMHIILGHFKHLFAYDHILYYYVKTDDHKYYNQLAFSWVYHLTLTVGISYYINLSIE